jgi:small nuclear ribonucleoprotein (snRNP)-like protein
MKRNEALDLLNKRVSVSYESKEAGGVLRGVDSYMNILLETKENTLIIRGDSVNKVKQVD